MRIDIPSILLLISLVLSVAAYSCGAIVLFTIGMEVFSAITFGLLTYEYRKHHSRYLICETVLLLILSCILDAIFFDAFIFEKNDFIFGLLVFCRFLYNICHYNVFLIMRYLKFKKLKK